MRIRTESMKSDNHYLYPLLLPSHHLKGISKVGVEMGGKRKAQIYYLIATEKMLSLVSRAYKKDLDLLYYHRENM